MTSNPLLEGIHLVVQRIQRFTEHAHAYYHDVLMSARLCPGCNGRLIVTGVSQASCQNCHTAIDPTITFQESDCCHVGLVKKRTHYACSRCGQIMLSRFLFNEKLFDADYFRTAMAESRERKHAKREELRRLLAQSRSDELCLSEVPDMVQFPGLLDDPADFLENTAKRPNDHTPVWSDFRMEAYRQIALGSVRNTAAHFDAIPTLEEDVRLDRARRFITLIFMEQGHEVRLEQMNDSILVIPCA